MRLSLVLLVGFIAHQAYHSLLLRTALDPWDSHPDLDRVDALFGLAYRAVEYSGLRPKELSQLTAKDLTEINKHRAVQRTVYRRYAEFAPQKVRDCWHLKTCSIRNVSFSSEDGLRSVESMLIENNQSSPSKLKRMIVYFHGGGTVNGDAYNAPVAFGIAAEEPSVLLSVAYRKAPENPYPAGVEDGYEALSWAFKNAEKLGADIGKMTVAGESAGSLFTSAVALLWKQRQRKERIHQLVLLIPMLAPVLSRSFVTFEDIHTLPTRNVGFSWDMYATNIYDCVVDPICSPGTATIQQLEDVAEKALVIYARADVLRNEAVEFARKLRLATVKTTVIDYRGTHLGVVLFDNLLDDPRVKAALA